MKDSGIDLSSPTFDKDRFGCIVGSGIGGVEWFENVSCIKINICLTTDRRFNLSCLRIVTTLLLLAEGTTVCAQ